MPYVQIPPDVFLEHNGVTVFYTYGSSVPWAYWFTTNPAASDDGGHPSHFDARMFTGLWSTTPSVGAWDDWWKHRFKTENEAVCALLRTAIEDGKVVALATGDAATAGERGES